MTEQPGKSKEQEVARRYSWTFNYSEVCGKDIEDTWLAGFQYALQQREQPWVRVEGAKLIEGEEYLIYQPLVDRVSSAFYHGKDGWRLFDDCFARQVTHYQNLPAPPKQ